MSTVTMLFTPGLDSFMAIDKLKRDNVMGCRDNLTLAYFDMNHRYAENEKSILLEDPYYRSNFNCQIFSGWDMSKLEREDAYIPNRNLLLLTQASSILDSDVILLNGVRDDRVPDNTPAFRAASSEALTESSNKPVSVISVIETKEKAELVKEYCAAHGFADTLRVAEMTYSCYSGEYYVENSAPYFIECGDVWKDGGVMQLRGCMRCHACFRRICAFASVGLMIPFHDYSITKKYKMDDGITYESYPHRKETIDKYYKFSNWVIGVE